MGRITRVASASLLIALAGAAGLDVYTVRYLPAAECTPVVGFERMFVRRDGGWQVRVGSWGPDAREARRLGQSRISTTNGTGKPDQNARSTGDPARNIQTPG
jgi:hypothetical protein